MGKQIKTLLSLQLKNFFNINVIRYSKNKRKRNSAVALLCTQFIVVLLVAFYIISLSYSLILLELSAVIPTFLIAISSMVVFIFAMLKTGNIIFQKSDYEILCSLPLKKNAIVLSRFLRMYIEDLILSIFVMGSGLAVYAIYSETNVVFFIVAFIATVFIPIFPITLATFLGTIITAVSSRMKHKSIIFAILSIVFIIGIMFLSTSLMSMTENNMDTFFQDLVSSINAKLWQIYPPSVWITDAMMGKGFIKFFIYIAGSLTIFAGVIALISAKFHEICRRLFSANSGHNLKPAELKIQKSSAIKSLYNRELKRYLASGIYITNTVVGPVLAVLMTAALLITGIDNIQNGLPPQINIAGAYPIILAAIFSMMTTSCSSISMEGKQWWITKSLPIRTRDVINSKLMVNFTVFVPFLILSQILAIIALKPDFMGIIWLILIPVSALLFSCVFGITINLKLPIFDWENEATVIKQSASSMLGGFGGFLIILITAIPIIFITFIPSYILKACVVLLLLAAAAILYLKDIKIDLINIE